jgi:hypothetical protein
MPRVRRHMPPDHQATSRQHSLGGTVITFNAENEADIDDPAILELLAQFPDVFEVVGAVPEPTVPVPPPVTAGAFTEADLDQLTVAELHDIAFGMNILGVRQMRKADLIEAILTQQRILGGGA